MTSSPGRSWRGLLGAGRIRRAAPFVLLVLILAAASLVPRGDDAALRLASSDRSHVEKLRLTIGDLPSGALVLVACDADFGTYPEIRAATRAAMLDLTAHDASLAMVSFTPEGRAIAAAEMDRIARDGATPPADLGFVTGSEAGLVRSVSSIVPPDASGVIPDAIRERWGGIGAFDLVLIVSGNDMSARSWVEQVGARLPELPMVAIAPTFLDPELEPYLRTGQLAALLATVREGAAYAQAVYASAGSDPRRLPSPLPMLVGMIVALAVMAEASLRRALAVRPARAPLGRRPS